jgi:hypothetical protein
MPPNHKRSTALLRMVLISASGSNSRMSVPSAAEASVEIALRYIVRE